MEHPMIPLFVKLVEQGLVPVLQCNVAARDKIDTVLGEESFTGTMGLAINLARAARPTAGEARVQIMVSHTATSGSAVVGHAIEKAGQKILSLLSNELEEFKIQIADGPGAHLFLVTVTRTKKG